MEGTTAFWGMVINNYDETDLALVQQGYPDFIRQLVYTMEVGDKCGTPHIQAYLKLYRAQRLSYVKKLFPRGSFKFLSNDEYKLNAQRYAQKLDATADSPAVINNNPFPDPVEELVSVIAEVISDIPDFDFTNFPEKSMLHNISVTERARVAEKPRMAKFYVSATYRSVKKNFWRSICENVVRTDAHTHKDEKLSHRDDITDASSTSSRTQEDCDEDCAQSCSSRTSSVSSGSF